MTDDKITALIAEARDCVENYGDALVKRLADALDALEALTANTETTVERGVIMPSGDEYDMHDLSNAEDYRRMWPTAKVVSRTVGRWKEESAEHCSNCGLEIRRGDSEWLHADGYSSCPEGFGTYAWKEAPND